MNWSNYFLVISRRKKIGLIYTYDENWIGGAYYIQNLVIAFNGLSDALKPLIVLYSEKEHFKNFKLLTQYKYLFHSSEYHPPFSFAARLCRKFFPNFFNRSLFNKNVWVLDLLFPVFDTGKSEESRTQLLYWIPDFQEHYLPNLFSKEEIDRRRDVQNRISVKKNGLLLLSSQSAFSDYKKLYPKAVTKNFIVPFAVSHPKYQHIDISTLVRKYGIKSKYFISSNQFWAHKNHLVIIKAAVILKKKNIPVCVVFTGKQHDWRNPEYFDILVNLVKENNLCENVLFLGLIDRLEQLQLMENAEAVIQSSRFEGWSTVIEDAKAMGQFVIASKISVHEEQLKVNRKLFDPEDANELANIMIDILADKPSPIKIDYNENVKKYALDFLCILEDI